MLCLAIVALALTGCGKSTEDPDVSLEMIKAHLEPPAEIKQNEQVTFSVKVTQGEKPVEDALDVEFEIWEENETEHQRVKAKHDKDGVYVIDIKLEKLGKYSIISHVTARGMHTMPTRHFTVVP